MRSGTKFDSSLRFVTRYYRHGFLSAREGWRELGIPVSIWRPWRIAAAVSAVVVLSASAALYLHYGVPAGEPSVETVAPQGATMADEVKRLDFTDAPLTQVVAEIERVYGVKVTGLPDETFTLTLSYEGSAADIVETINALLGTHLAIEKPSEDEKK